MPRDDYIADPGRYWALEPPSKTVARAATEPTALATNIYPGTTPPPTGYIPGSTVAITPTEIAGLLEVHRAMQSSPELFQWSSVLPAPPGWQASMDLLKQQARWAYENYGGAVPGASSLGGAPGASAAPTAGGAQPSYVQQPQLPFYYPTPTTGGASSAGGTLPAPLAGVPTWSAYQPTSGAAATPPMSTPEPPASGLPSARYLGYLENFITERGYPTNVTPAWQAMVEAQQRALERGAADLASYYSTMGLRLGSDFDRALADYWSQARLGQAAQLGQLALSAEEAARARQLAAAEALGGYGFQGWALPASWEAQQRVREYDIAAQLASQLASQQYGAAQQLYGGALAGAQGLAQNAMLAAQLLYGTETAASMAEAQRQLALQQLGLGAASDLSRLWGANLALGGQLGLSQYATLQDQINRLYQEWLRTQPYSHPLLGMLFSAATGYPPFMATYKPSWWESVLPAAGLALGGLFSWLGG